MRSLRLLPVCVPLVLAALAFARHPCAAVWADEAEAMQPLEQARALVKAGKFAESLPLFDQALVGRADERGVWAEAAQAAKAARQSRRALGYAQRALEGADDAFKTSDTGKALLALLPTIEALVRRQDATRKSMAEFLVRSIEGVTRHAAITVSPLLKKAKEKGVFELKDPDKMFEDGFGCRVTVEKEGPVRFSLMEWYVEEDLAMARFDSVLAKLRAQKDLWQRSHVHATEQRGIPLYEVSKAQPEGSTAKRSTAFCWSEVNCATTAVAHLDLVGPGSEPPDPAKAHLPPQWLVMTAFASYTFKLP